MAVTVASIAKGLGVGLATNLGGRAGAQLIQAVFPVEVPTYFDEVYREITRIVKEALTELEIQKINAQINHTQEWVRFTYLEHTSDWPVERKLQELQEELDRLGPMIKLLEDPAFAEAGFSVFMVAGGLQLSLLQEQVLVASKAADPGHRAYVHTMHQTAQLRFNFAIDALIRILRSRDRSVKLEGVSEMYDDDGMDWRWHDTVAGKKGGKSDHKRQAEAKRQARVDEVCRRLIEDLKDPAATALDWLALKLGYAASPLCRTLTTTVNGHFFDYSTIEGYAERAGVEGWSDLGIYGWMGSKDGKQPGADVPFYRLEAANDPKRVLIAFDEGSYAAAQKVGWKGSGKGRGLLGYLWRDPAKVPAGTPIPVYPLGAQEEGLSRTMLATSQEEYKSAQRNGWGPVSHPGLVGYLCSQG